MTSPYPGYNFHLLSFSTYLGSTLLRENLIGLIKIHLNKQPVYRWAVFRTHVIFFNPAHTKQRIMLETFQTSRCIPWNSKCLISKKHDTNMANLLDASVFFPNNFYVKNQRTHLSLNLVFHTIQTPMHIVCLCFQRYASFFIPIQNKSYHLQLADTLWNSGLPRYLTTQEESIVS